LRRPGLRLRVNPPFLIVTDTYIVCQAKLFPLQVSLYFIHIDVNTQRSLLIGRKPDGLSIFFLYTFADLLHSRLGPLIEGLQQLLGTSSVRRSTKTRMIFSSRFRL
jgi:hypothetical protein